MLVPSVLQQCGVPYSPWAAHVARNQVGEHLLLLGHNIREQFHDRVDLGRGQLLVLP